LSSLPFDIDQILQHLIRRGDDLRTGLKAAQGGNQLENSLRIIPFRKGTGHREPP